MYMNILKARDVAMVPNAYAEEERKKAVGALVASAEKNKDRDRAAQDRKLAKTLSTTFGAGE